MKQERRVVVTGLGIVSCIGNDLTTVVDALRQSRSGIRFVPEYEALGLNSRIAGIPDVSVEPSIDRKSRRFMRDAAIYAHHAMRKAIADARLPTADIRSPRTALIVGSGVGSPMAHHQAMEVFKAKGIDKLLPYYVPQVMGSTTSANLATTFHVGGPSYSITAACASSAHCIGNAADLIRHGVVDRAFAGGAEEVCWTTTVPFDAMQTLSAGWNHAPESASRPFDIGRDGFVIAGGAGMLVLETEAAARQRGARIYGEIAGYGASSDGVVSDMVRPSAQGISRAMATALAAAGNPSIDCINPHATSTLQGDLMEMAAIRGLFQGAVPPISATKGLTGHSIAAISAQEAILCLLMMEHGFMPACANLKDLDPELADMPVVRQTMHRNVETIMSNSIGFGGTNASLVFRKV